MIRVQAQLNAKNMLLSVATPLGKENGVRYFIVDGKAWKIGRNDVVYRSEDSDETSQLIRKFKHENCPTD